MICSSVNLPRLISGPSPVVRFPAARGGETRGHASADRPDEALNVNEISRSEIRELCPCRLGELDQGAVDCRLELRHIKLGKGMSDPRSILLDNFGFEEHVPLGTPEERQVGDDCPLRAAAGPQDPVTPAEGRVRRFHGEARPRMHEGIR